MRTRRLHGRLPVSRLQGQWPAGERQRPIDALAQHYTRLIGLGITLCSLSYMLTHIDTKYKYNVAMSYDNAKPNCEHVEVCVVRHRSQARTHTDPS